MIMNKFPYTPQLKPFQDADDAWQAEINRVFGKKSNARYLDIGKGESGTVLRSLYEARMAAKAAWRNSSRS
jgi:hypothetical protein